MLLFVQAGARDLVLRRLFVFLGRKDCFVLPGALGGMQHAAHVPLAARRTKDSVMGGGTTISPN